MADSPELSPIARLIEAIRAEKIRFIVVGMTAAVLQGVPSTTFDVDLWIDLPKRQYMRMINLAIRLGGEMLANTLVCFSDDVIINFIYEVTGLASFKTEYKRTIRIDWLGHEVALLPLDRIYKSKSTIRRPKDLVHMENIRQTLQCQEHIQSHKK